MTGGFFYKQNHTISNLECTKLSNFTVKLSSIEPVTILSDTEAIHSCISQQSLMKISDEVNMDQKISKSENCKWNNFRTKRDNPLELSIDDQICVHNFIICTKL